MSSFLRVLALLSVVVASSQTFAGSMMMKPAEYQKFLQRLETSIPVWQQQVQQIDLANIPANRREGRKSGLVAVALLQHVFETIQFERERPSLARQIYMNRDLSMAASALSEATRCLPKEQQPRMAEIFQEVGKLNTILFVHLTAEADDYESRLDDCCSGEDHKIDSDKPLITRYLKVR